MGMGGTTGLAAGRDAWLISIGNELLIGRVVNTNFAWLGRRLTVLGYKVRGGIVVPDDVDDIAWGFRTALGRGASVIISTGGLGPTFDDKTAEGLAKALGVPLILNEEALRMVREKYERAGMGLTEARVKMARLPEGGKPIPNPVGTAPGVEVEVSDALIFLLPGVPSEMQAMFETYVEPKLREGGPKVFFAETTLISVGLPESEAAPLIAKAMKMSERAYIKSHPKGAELGRPLLELHITASGSSKDEALAEVERVAKALRELLEEKGAAVKKS